MNRTTSYLPQTIACARIATSIFFLLFGEYKVADGSFAHSGFQEYLKGYTGGEAVGFYKPVLVHLISPHAVFFGYLVGVIELLVGMSLLIGLFVRVASVLGIFLLLNLILSTWFAPGHGVPIWRYFGNELDHLPLLFLLIIFFVANAGEIWGLDKKRRLY